MVWESTPGKKATAAPQTGSHGKPSLIVVVHTECPCSAATLGNLLTLSAGELSQLDIEIVITGPNAGPGSRAKNVSLAKSIREAKISFCTEGEAAQKFHAETSGQAFLYDTSGKLVFSGGLTTGRGVPGDSAGLKAIHALLQGKAGPSTAPVYGCALQTPKP